MDIIEQITYEMLEFFNRFSSWETSIVKAGNLTLSEAHALEVLGTHGTMNMKALAEKLGVTTGTTTVTVDRLERKGYARRETTEKDRRVYLIGLTKAGQEAFEEHHRYHMQLTEELISHLREDEITQLLAILQKLNRHLF
ncbi:MarR family winged helix-turn-helix transcriptional regulator [Candidatus Pyrohabitans sp.]